ncbi:ABC transporter substrate-binding protein [Ectobacillus funiculus]|uniref:ABC transporter substrate-binding protein n=1 Tax=Ectobacillus funiculus TaxID=137993 RepID=UPI00397A1545
MKKKVATTLVTMLSAVTLFGCSSGEKSSTEAKGDQVKLTVFSSASEQETKNAMTKITESFEKENPNIDVEIQFPGQDYENMMKVKMAANDLPDVFDTHGWSKIRYGKYLADLKDQEWASQLTDSIKPVVTDEQGKVYALPLNEAKDGITYNAEILEKYGISVPKTMDELIAAGEKIKKESNGKVTPFFFSGIDSSTIGQFFDYFATPLLISPEKNYADALLDGKFDWSGWTALPEKLKEMNDKGLINKDVLTAKRSDIPQMFANGEVAFLFDGPQSVTQAKEMNPKVKVGYMPVPAMVAGDEPAFSGGERYTMAVWKDSKHVKEAKKLLAYFAKTENLKTMAETTGLPAGIKGVNEDLGDLTKYYQEYASTRVFPYFDRVYLPNGMWDVLCTQGQELLAGSITPKQFSEKMEKEVERLRNQQQK